MVYNISCCKTFKNAPDKISLQIVYMESTLKYPMIFSLQKVTLVLVSDLDFALWKTSVSAEIQSILQNILFKKLSNSIRNT